MGQPGAVPPRSARAEPQAPRRWWQWFLMYPTLVVVLVPAIFQFVQWATAIGYGLSPFGDTKEALGQLHAWERNAGCLKGGDIDSLETRSPIDYQIHLLPCPSGDILLTLVPLRIPDRQVNRWVITRDLFASPSAGSLVGSALAQATATQPQPVRVIGVRQQGTTIIKRTQLSNGNCIDQTIDGLTGRQLSQAAAPCVPF